MNITERINSFILLMKLSLTDFDRSIGTSNGYIGKQIKNAGSIGSHIIEKIIAAYPTLSVQWLITGKGEMFNHIIQKITPGVNKDLNLTIDSGLTLIDMQPDSIKAIANTFNLEDSETGNEDYLCLMYKSEGMLPGIVPGTYLIVSNFELIDSKPVGCDNIILVSTPTTTHIGRLIESSNSDNITISKDNHDKEKFPDIQINKSAEYSYWCVKGYIYSEQNTSMVSQKMPELNSIFTIEEKLAEMQKEIDKLKLKK